MSKWLQFTEVDNPQKKTKKWLVERKDGTASLGVIAWYGAWRGYTFQPPVNAHSIFEKHCLRDIADFIEEQNWLHKETLRQAKTALGAD
jgi:hypothetical protein